jgi:hypothetical protein
LANLSGRKPNDRFHGLIYGQSGSGKTNLIGTFPKPYIIDTDFGLEGLVGKDIDYDEYYTRVGEAGAKDIWPTILEKVESFANPTHDTLAVDSLTTIMDVVIAAVLSKAGHAKIQLQDYNTLYDEITKLVVRLRRVPCHVVVTAHEETIRDENSGKLMVIPLVTGNKLAPKLPLYFNNIFNITLQMPKSGTDKVVPRKLLVQPDGTRLAKTQAVNSDFMIDKSYESIMTHLSRKS